MAVKPITNKNVVSKEKINRGKQISTRSQTDRGNSRENIVPGKDFSKGYAITLKDIDVAMVNHIKNVMKPTVKEANETIKVPVLYGNEERWKAVRKRGVLRDKNGSIIFPLIVVRRTDVVFNDAMPLSFDQDVTGEHIKVVRSTNWSKDNRYDRFAVQNGIKPAQETITTGMPDFVNCTYQIVMMTNYIEQMNYLTELFIEHENTYFGDEYSYKFLSVLEGGFSDASEMTVEGERLIRTDFGMVLKGYVIPQFTNTIVTGKTSEIIRNISPTRVVFGFEGDATSRQTAGTSTSGENGGGAPKLPPVPD